MRHFTRQQLPESSLQISFAANLQGRKFMRKACYSEDEERDTRVNTSTNLSTKTQFSTLLAQRSPDEQTALTLSLGGAPPLA